LVEVKAPVVYVGIYIVDIRCAWVQSLKEKRAIVKPLTEKLKARFPISVARLAGLDEHDWERLGVSAISHDGIWLEQLLNRVHDFVCSQGSYEVFMKDLSIEIWDFDDG
jgi:hypothetical protein